jgi:hypothetical protein
VIHCAHASRGGVVTCSGNLPVSPGESPDSCDAQSHTVLMRLLLLLLSTALIAQGAAPIRVLFIGNSLTVTNDIPATVEALAKANGERIVTKTVAYPNFSLEDHWGQGDARQVIAQGGWSFIVLQQGPSPLPESRVLLVDFAKRFAKEAKRVKARTALYMVWPAWSRSGDFDGVKLSYETAAREAGAIFLPAGEAWRLAWKQDANLEFYGPDGFHPSQLGSYLAALVIYQALTGKPLVRLAASYLSDTQIRRLQQAASQALGHE